MAPVRLTPLLREASTPTLMISASSILSPMASSVASTTAFEAALELFIPRAIGISLRVRIEAPRLRPKRPSVPLKDWTASPSPRGAGAALELDVHGMVVLERDSASVLSPTLNAAPCRRASR
jgi:hypothetical protein